jgi:hypothetical protein
MVVLDLELALEIAQEHIDAPHLDLSDPSEMLGYLVSEIERLKKELENARN